MGYLSHGWFTAGLMSLRQSPHLPGTLEPGLEQFYQGGIYSNFPGGCRGFSLTSMAKVIPLPQLHQPKEWHKGFCLSET